MAKPNYAFAKRQRDLAKKQKKEEKRLRKAATNPDGSPVTEMDAETPVEPGTDDKPPAV
jgi:hypothetical protein